ncbi:putative cysteine desulfurase [Panicum miliaceum]|uniref:Cysteine desulfurase n=1 Tax=Panicum miliaceum TaxID=4540 RepID=A0A3L6Q178_PANMI|nr:putative cysteine desulfurase [Panicum miliaceum]
MPSLQAVMGRGEAGGGLGSNDDTSTTTTTTLVSLLRARSERSAREEERVEWVRSQLVGRDAEFETPFGRRALLYADHTATGRSLRYIEDYILKHVLPFYGNTHTEDSYVGSRTTRTARKAARYIKRCMGAGPGDVLLFCGSGATAAARRLQEALGVAPCPPALRRAARDALRPEERWVVFVGPYEHHSNLLSWRRSLADVVEVPAGADGLVDLAALRSALAAPELAFRPMLGAFSACSNVTGVLTDTRAIARLLHQHGAFACFDFAASGPYVDIDMRSGEMDGYDAVFLSPHKFVGGPGTPGILLMNRALYRLAGHPPSTCGGGTVAYVNGFSDEDTVYYDDIEEREDAGTPPIVQKVRAALAFWVKEHVGRGGAVALRERAYADAAMARLRANPNVEVLGNVTARRLPIFSFLVYPPGGNGQRRLPLHGRFVARLLNDLFGIQARGGCACAGPYGHALLGVGEELSLRIRAAIVRGYHGVKPGWTRVSLAYYMSREEVRFVLAAVDFVAAHGHRFLPLYGFDWATGDWAFRRRTFKHHLMREELLRERGGDNRRDDAESHTKKKSTAGGGGDHNNHGLGDSSWYESYLESASRIALSLPDTYDELVSSVPKGIDPDIILFRV